MDPPAETPKATEQKRGKTCRLLWLLWLAGLVSYLGICLTPISTRMTRLAAVAFLFICWFGLIVLLWRRSGRRLGLLGVTVLMGCFLIAPGRRPPADILREDYVRGLERYDGVTYYWGGESPKGIDCSRLIRRGLIDSTFIRGATSFNPGLLRYAIKLWWHDCSADDLGNQYLKLTTPVLDTASLNRLDPSRILAGDLAVTAGGGHIMAYLGSNIWIEADPGAERVITVEAPCQTNAWFTQPMKIMRWQILQN